MSTKILQKPGLILYLSLFAALTIGLLAFASPARANGVRPEGVLLDGIIIPEPPICDPGPCPPPPCLGPEPCPPVPPAPPIAQLAIRYHRVTVTIRDQVAVTHVDQVFYNPNNWTVEGTYLFPLPKDAAVSGFTLWVDGQAVEGKVLDADQARQTYEEIVRSLRDPALLEYAGRGAVQARIFPIPSKGERRVELEYSQALTAENGLVRYVYPLNTEKFSALPIENMSINVEIHSGVPIRAVYSPSHTVAINRQDDHTVTAGYEASNVRPDADFALYYSLGETQAFHLLTYRDPVDPQDPDGFFLLLLAPQPDAAAQTLGKDVVLVLDHSGSMEGEKFQQAQAALKYILQHLNPEDRFNLVAFSTGVERYASGLRPASEAAEALPWIDRLGAQGSTDINRALLETAAMVSSPERPSYVIFLTDGLPTEGETDSQKILDNFARAASPELRLFTFGVGYDVDTFLLDSLAQEHHGASSYVQPGERLDETLSAFYAKISTPVLTDLSLDFGGAPVYDLYPSPLPDLFAGSQIILVGRYRQPAEGVTVTLQGKVNGKVQKFEFAGQVFAADSRSDSGALASLPRLWATRKIGYLLNQVRLNGPDKETVDQIVRLSIRYGIVTPYTSYLVTEPMPLGAAEQDRIAGEQLNALQAAAPTTSGQEAVQKAAGQGAMAEAESAPASPEGAASQVRIVGARTFVYANGAWVDTAFDPDTMQTVKVAFLSPDYFALSESRPELAAAFALGQRVIALADGRAYEVVAADAKVAPVKAPTGQPTTPAVGATPAKPSTPAARPLPIAPGSVPCGSALIPLLMLLMWRLLRLRGAR